MRHDIRVEGHAFALRPVERKDAGFIVELRSGDPSRTRFLHPVPPSVGLQEEWLDRYFERKDDYYWVVERRGSGAREGLIGIYDLDPHARIAEWGRWVLQPRSLAAVESALLIYRTAFDILGLGSVHCITVADNGPVVSFHDSCGLPKVEILKDRFRLGELSFDGVKHHCGASMWDDVRARLEPQALRIARRFTDNR
jgi:RimJ/RimL family protein N-acetyltransferase